MEFPDVFLVAGLIFVAAGLVKGLVGFGLPALSLGLLTLIMGHQTAITLILVPSLVTNFWQAFSGAHFSSLLKRLWLFLVFAAVTVWAGALVLTRLQDGWSETLLGNLFILYALPGLAGLQPRLSPSAERWLAVPLGLLNGLFTGLTGTFNFPGVIFFQSLGLTRDELVQAMGLLFLISTVALWLSLFRVGYLEADQLGPSIVMMVPTFIGVYVGQRFRKGLSERAFRRVVLATILGLGLYLLAVGLPVMLGQSN